ncbi:hypothetical protein BDU57DRAFT_541217 [Ampelomyces quisqualis]|uniref:Uncharacterized protein n=1 Tax=Ampelomyces quisqualis TaxID=50730 RepID=A0A6A5QG94_AMPQU|nr:hypothetical protein BDU57DRAFT_541217 [Ampelomyces quisqualis]
MPESQRDDCGGANGTAPIFDDAVYLSEALRLPMDQTEDDLDAQLALLATDSGIQDPYLFLCPPQDISRAPSPVTLDSDHRSSLSIHSQETQSTSFTSAPSRTSRDQAHHSERLPAMRSPPTVARAWPAMERQDRIGQLPPPSLEHISSSSSLSVAQFVLYDSLMSSNPAHRRKRASGLFGMFRRDSSSCTSPSHQEYHGKARGPKLECGHTLSPAAIRIHIQEAVQGGEQAVPSCCGKPLPRTVLEVVLAKEEAELVVNRALPSSGGETIRDSGYMENRTCSLDVHPPPRPSSPCATSTSLPIAATRRRHEAISIDSALAKEAFTSFRKEERVQFERVVAFESNQREALSAHHTTSLKRLVAQHEASKDEKTQQHRQDIEHLDEMQVVAEHDLRKTHEIETQNVATAMKHMEAYCLGSGLSHPQHPYVVTEEDFKKLDRQRMIQQNLPRKQENVINVLRARQERDMKNKLLKQEEELALLDAAYDRERTAEELEQRKEMERLEAIIEVRRKRLIQRWDLRFEMWRRDWEHQHGTAVTLRLEHETWPLQTSKTTTPIHESSPLAPYIQAAA